MKEPICPHCQARLVTVTRNNNSGIVATLAILVGMSGLVLILFHWIIGGIVLIIALLINAASKGKQTVLTCPACRTDARILD